MEMFLLLGRLDGKMDALTVMHTVTAKRLDDLERDVGDIKLDVTAIKATSGSSQTWMQHLGTVAALAVSGLAVYFGVT